MRCAEAKGKKCVMRRNCLSMGAMMRCSVQCSLPSLCAYSSIASPHWVAKRPSSLPNGKYTVDTTQTRIEDYACAGIIPLLIINEWSFLFKTHYSHSRGTMVVSWCACLMLCSRVCFVRLTISHAVDSTSERELTHYTDSCSRHGVLFVARGNLSV